MKHFYPVVVALLLVGVVGPCGVVLAQQYTLALPNGATHALPPAAQLKPAAIAQMAFDGQHYALVHFQKLPPANWSRAHGAQVLQRLSAQDYVVSFATPPTPAQLSAAGISHIGAPQPAAKLSKALLAGNVPGHARAEGGGWRLVLSIHPNVSLSKAQSWAAENGLAFQPLAQGANIYSTTASAAQLALLAQQPFVAHVQAANPPDRTLNQNVRSTSRAISLNATLASGGRHLQGQGVVAGVGDDADPTLHPDLTDRVIDRSIGLVNNHGTHVAGTVAGGGLVVDANKGFAPLATLVTQFFSGIWEHAVQYVQDFDMVLTNNSYGQTIGDCYYNGVYDLYSNALDAQAQSLPNLLHVFAAGNSGGDLCPPLPGNFGTVLGSYQSAKNTVCVGRADLQPVVSQSSSRGPVKDGRIKPDLVVLGALVSTWGPDDYRAEVGTSMSAPSATGGLVLLNERYRQLHSTTPRGDLMKNLLLNGARDIENAGPDFKAGFGLMHLENSLRMLEQNRYALGTVGQGNTVAQVITVPAGTAALKVMLYWHDQPAHPLAAHTLVNDLDLQVVTPGNATVLPKLLDPTPLHVNAPATEGVDRTNNVEQVVIINPAPGNYTIRTSGYAVPVGPTQPFTISYDFLPTSMHISAPFAGSRCTAGESIAVAWDDEGTPPATYTLEYSTDNGSNWVVAESNIPASQRYRSLVFPAGTATSQALVRLSKSGAPAAVSGLFTVIGKPNHALAPNAEQCPGYIKLNWSTVTGADEYEVLMKQGVQMTTVAVVPSATLSYTFSGLHPDSMHYVTVAARKNGQRGQYNYAQIRRPNVGACGSGISNGDLRLDSIVAPLSGRLGTLSALTGTQNLVVRVRNLDDAAIGSYDIKYRVNGGPLTTVAINVPIAANSTATHTVAGLNLLAAGTYTIEAIVENSASPDNVPQNDSLTTVVKQLPNPPLTLTGVPLVENFDGGAAAELSRSTMGIANLPAWDYANFDRRGRARTFVNTGLAQSGQRAITLDVSKAPPTLVTPGNLLMGTFNLSPHTLADDVRADFSFASHGSFQQAHPLNRVWVRGSEADPWVEVYNLGANQAPAGLWKKSPSLEISDVLQAAGQSFSSSTQLRFGQWGQYSMADATHLSGYSFDDVRLYLAQNDVQVLSIDAPGIYSCGLNQSVPISATVRNSMGTALANVPISYTINGGAPVNEVIPNLPANASLMYTFAAQANLQAAGSYSIIVSSAMPGDNVPENNAASATVINQQVVAAFPYLENFEQGNGGYYVSGINSSWQYGTPASLLINTAASGTKAWKTTLVGDYKAVETSYLNSPCFNTVGLQNPTLSFSMAYDLEDCSPYNVVCDAAWVEYSTDGKTWAKLGAFGQGTNWYDNAGANVWMKRRQSHWHVATVPLPANVENLRLRFAMKSDEYTTYEGVAIDDIHIYSNSAPLYVGNANSAAVLEPLSGSTFLPMADAGQLLATVNPEGANLGSTEAKLWMHNGPVRVFQNQYYGSRTLTLKPANNPPGSKTLRYYFSDAEANALRNATGCVSCTPPKDFSEMAITQYTNTNKALEDGDFANNTGGTYTFYDDANVDFVPYDKGYYAEFSVDSFSEFWLNDGNVGLILPVKWLSFNATKLSANAALLQWQVEGDEDARQYGIELAVGDVNYALGRFESIGSLAALQQRGAVFYAFTHANIVAGQRLYYRIAQTDRSGERRYSAVRLLQYGGGQLQAGLQPNPVRSQLLVKLTAEAAGPLQVRVTNAVGKLVFEKSERVAAGQHLTAINSQGWPKGVYFVSLWQGGLQFTGKVVKE
jgi:hypothetical protein